MRTASAQASRYAFGLADRRDDAHLRAILRGAPMGSDIRVTFEREPNYFAAVSLQGDFVQVPVVRDAASQTALGMGARAVARAFLNGEASPVGYLGDLRLDPAHRGGTLVARGYRYLRELHDDGRAPLYYSLVVADNAAALNTLAGGRAGLPAYHDLGLVRSPAVNLLKPLPPLAADCEIRRGTPELLGQIIACLNRNNRRRQFAPEHIEKYFAPGGRWRGFGVTNFYAALRGGKVVGTLGRWDERAFKQTRVAGYGGKVRWAKALCDAARPLLEGTRFAPPRLPEPGEHAAHFYACFAAVDHDDLGVFRALLRRLYNDAVGGEFLYFILALHERDPLAAAYADYSLTSFAGRLFCVCYPDGERIFRALDARVPYVEVAAL